MKTGNNKMRKTTITTKRAILISALALLCGVTTTVGAMNLHTATAAVSEVSVCEDNFNAAALDENWIVSDASIVSDYASLRVQPTEYGWTAHIICQGYKLDGSCRLEMQTQQLSDDNSGWFALSFGAPTTSSIFEKASGALIFYSGGTWVFANGENTGKTQPHTPMGRDGAVTTIVDFSEKSDGLYDITYTLKSGETTLGSSVLEDFEVQDGYFGFNSSNTDFEVLSFDVYEGEEKVYADDFSSSRMSYTDNVIKDSEWMASSPWTTKSASIAPVGKLDLRQIGASVTYATPFEKKSTELVTLYTMSATFNFSAVGAASGFEIGKSTADGEGTFIGVARTYFGYDIVLCEGERTETRTLTESVSDGNVSVTLRAKYDNTVQVTIGNQTESFSVQTIEGYFGLKTFDRYTKKGTGAFADDFSFTRNVYEENTTADVGVNFEGVREYEDEDGKYYQYYLPTKDWQSGNNVRLSNYSFASKNGYALFGNATELSAFGPKTKFADCIVRFDVTLIGNDYYYDHPDSYNGECNEECFGLKFGLENYSNYNYYFNVQTLGIKSAHNGKSIYYATNCTRQLNADEIVHSATDSTQEYDLFRKNATYNFMYVIKNGTVSMHFKEASEPEEVLEIVREYVTGVKTNGYLSVYGANGVDFRLDNFSVTNLERDLTSSAYTGGENLTTLRLDTTKGDALSTAFDVSECEVTTKAITGGHIARLQFGDMDGFTYRQGEFSVAFTGDGATVSDGKKQETISFAKQLSFNGATVEITRMGGKVSIAFANADMPLSALEENVYTADGFETATRAAISISSENALRIVKAAIFNLDSNVYIEARDFNEETDIVQPWKVRENIQGKELPKEGDDSSATDSGCKSVASGISAVILLPLALLLKKKERKDA